jgi:hypothetical protein
MYTFTCEICGAKTDTSTRYDDVDCRCCGQPYVYEEGIGIRLSAEQKRLLLDHWLKTLDEKKKETPP